MNLCDPQTSHFEENAGLQLEIIEVFGRGPVAYVGFRYGGADEWVKRYDRIIVEIQKKYMERLLPDDAAVRLK